MTGFLSILAGAIRFLPEIISLIKFFTYAPKERSDAVRKLIEQEAAEYAKQEGRPKW